MTMHEMVAGLMVRCDHLGKRPNGLQVILNRNNWLQMRGREKWEPARFRANDILAEDWSVVPVPVELMEPITSES